jgi:hypothetical protein
MMMADGRASMKVIIVLGAREYAFDQVIRMMGKAIILNEEDKISPINHPIEAGRSWYRMHSYFKNEVEQILRK